MLTVIPPNVIGCALDYSYFNFTAGCTSRSMLCMYMGIKDSNIINQWAVKFKALKSPYFTTVLSAESGRPCAKYVDLPLYWPARFTISLDIRSHFGLRHGIASFESENASDTLFHKDKQFIIWDIGRH